SAPFQAPPGQGLYWVMALHRTMDGNLLAGLFSPASLARQSLSGAVDPAQSTVVLSAPGGVTLFQAGPLVGSGLLVNPPGIVNALNGESGIDYLHSSTGEHVVAFSPVSPLGWGLMFEETWENIASPLLSTTQATPLILAPLLVLALVALGFGARQIVQPLQALQGETAELAHGNFEAIEKPVGGINEIRMLQNDLAAMARELQAAQDSLRGYIGAITAGVENERLNLARELHDDTLQTLIALQQRIHLASLAGENLQPLVDVQQTVQSTITNLRQMLRGLRPIYLEDLGLNAALGMLVSENAVAGGTEITYTCTGEERRLAPEIELALYRMAQEAVSNIYRHATARHAWVALTYLENRVILEIRDDGRGFIVPDTTAGFARGGHFGLLGLHERAEIIAASLQIHSQPGQGAVVRIEKSGGFLPE
ncbi:MAG TPA: sensor histidine kinase, partial [Anaerolineales bacterium]